MKRLFILLAAWAVISPSFSAYYVAGNGGQGNPWCDGKNWQANGSLMASEGNLSTITFSAVPAGSYQFKITNGTWDRNWGFTNFDQLHSNIQAIGNGDGNVCFQITEQQNLTITFDGSAICLQGDGHNELDTADVAVIGVPSEYEGVMLQGFYWDSYTTSNRKYSDTKWATLDANYADAIAEDFDLIWLPPSGYGGGVGYYTKTYSNQGSAWGSKQALRSLIGNLHSKGVKVIADIVINHRQSASGWAQSFTPENFEGYGTWQITSEHICSGDEAFTDSGSDSRSLPHGNADTGDNDGGCRDLDHTSEYVQDYIKAYLNWMRDSMQYDGWRYDMVKGYSGSFVSKYNLSSEPFFSVGEYWDGDASALKMYLQSAKYNTTVFDFCLKFTLNSSIGVGSYSKLKAAGMRSIGLEKYAVTFIDNHDTFERSDNQGSEFIGYNKVLSSNRPKILQANAYLLMMPGTPCVFWPHWYTFRDEIHELIALRKAAGIHNESVVTDESASGSAYSATVNGHNGSIVLRMGSGRDTNVPAGYTLAITGPNMEIYMSAGVNYTPSVITSVNNIELPSSLYRKFMENGHLYIECNGSVYDALGRQIR